MTSARQYFYYKDDNDYIYKYTIKRIYDNKTVYYNCSDTKCNVAGVLKLDKSTTEKYKEINNIKDFISKEINNNKYHSIDWEKHSYNSIKYLKEEIDNNKVTIEKLKNSFYRLDYLKEYAFRNFYKTNNEIYNDFME